MTERMFEAHFILAGEGKACWERIEQTYHADLYVLFPHQNDSYNYYALLHLDRFIENNHREKVVLLSSDDTVRKAYPYFVKNEVDYQPLTTHETDALLKYYALYEFSSGITIISLTRPYDTYGENLLGVKGVTKEDLLCYDIYRFQETPDVKRPIYEGTDPDIADFMKLGGEQ